jgi:hypothetical protein
MFALKLLFQDLWGGFCHQMELTRLMFIQAAPEATSFVPTNMGTAQAGHVGQNLMSDGERDLPAQYWCPLTWCDVAISGSPFMPLDDTNGSWDGSDWSDCDLQSLPDL